MLGAIADDFTGATDLATMLRRSGHRVAVVVEDAALTGDAIAAVDAVVIALKTRTAPVDEAVAASRRSIEQLRRWGADRFYVKYCSTFDSTERGNIGPVLDAAADLLDAQHVVVVPSLPANGRTVYRGHLFVGSDLLEHSPMRYHPLTPMTHSRVADLLRPQTPHPAAEISLPVVRAGVEAIRRSVGDATARYLVVDAIDDADLATIGLATSDDVLVSGGSGLALGIAGPGIDSRLWYAPTAGRRVVLCGSVSSATRRQIDNAARTQPVRLIDLDRALRDVGAEIDALEEWVRDQPADRIPLISAARVETDVRATVDGVAVAPLVERILSELAARLTDRGETAAIIVAGGESSGAVVRRLGVDVLHIAPELAPGVCWSLGRTGSGHDIALALESGNFGRDDLFTDAWEKLR